VRIAGGARVRRLRTSKANLSTYRERVNSQQQAHATAFGVLDEGIHTIYDLRYIRSGYKDRYTSLRDPSHRQTPTGSPLSLSLEEEPEIL
jgi:hypothetical protein